MTPPSPPAPPFVLHGTKRKYLDGFFAGSRRESSAFFVVDDADPLRLLRTCAVATYHAISTRLHRLASSGRLTHHLEIAPGDAPAFAIAPCTTPRNLGEAPRYVLAGAAGATHRYVRAADAAIDVDWERSAGWAFTSGDVRDVEALIRPDGADGGPVVVRTDRLATVRLARPGALSLLCDVLGRRLAEHLARVAEP